MNEKPILFNTPMVKAILDGRKTQTRRVVLHSKRTPDYFGRGKFYKMVDSLNGKPFFGAGFYNDKNVFEHEGKTIIDAFYIKPKYEPGDILWVRETWQENTIHSEEGKLKNPYLYKADPDGVLLRSWKPSIHMPRKAARLFLEVKSVQVERLQDISERGANLEGCLGKPNCMAISRCGTSSNACSNCRVGCREEFIALWNTLNFKSGYSWESNPWVFVYECVAQNVVS